MKRVGEQRLDGLPTATPPLSPKGTTRGLSTTCACDIRSPGTMANLRLNPSVEINIVIHS